MRRYLVIFEKTTTGYSAYAHDLPGCVASGANKEITEQNIYQAIQFHIEGLQAEGLTVPEGKSESEILVISN